MNAATADAAGSIREPSARGVDAPVDPEGPDKQSVEAAAETIAVAVGNGSAGEPASGAEELVDAAVVAAADPPAERSFRLILTSTPENVRTYRGQVLIGRTPIDQDIVLDTDILEIELRKTHFDPLRVRLPTDQQVGRVHLHLSHGDADRDLHFSSMRRFQLNVRSVPNRARVYVNEAFVGRTPL